MTVAELRVRMSAQEFGYWMAFYAVEPFGEWRDDYRAGLIASTIVNMNSAKGSKKLSPLDMMPLIERRPVTDAQAAPEAAREKLMAWMPKPA